MSDTFFDKSKAIANDFIQSVVFLDDKAYKGKDNENPNHDFDALKITQAFAKENKICAVSFVHFNTYPYSVYDDRNVIPLKPLRYG